MIMIFFTGINTARHWALTVHSHWAFTTTSTSKQFLLWAQNCVLSRLRHCLHLLFLKSQIYVSSLLYGNYLISDHSLVLFHNTLYSSTANQLNWTLLPFWGLLKKSPWWFPQLPIPHLYVKLCFPQIIWSYHSDIQEPSTTPHCLLDYI